ncbi:hypothetical protein BDB00DRAFT_813780 [Zychaea mexicana]|uniref:uncharacterized protein n=1 Tax=Zychaea mexicana TaxID=64656 RepID=UPI0022FE722A|nr:uncharacterized protein BDB00DRAFT_813780 [Zychaea mexicana]KAI9495548.1 hypothetical protein BDB00DRAFT_813780 [Zychaea mexicana]
MTMEMLLPSLPNEIQDEIFQYLSLSDCWVLARVCKAWRFMVLNWQPLWSCLVTLLKRSIVPDILPYIRLSISFMSKVSMRFRKVSF